MAGSILVVNRVPALCLLWDMQSGTIIVLRSDLYPLKQTTAANSHTSEVSCLAYVPMVGITTGILPSHPIPIPVPILDHALFLKPSALAPGPLGVTVSPPPPHTHSFPAPSLVHPH